MSFIFIFFENEFHDLHLGLHLDSWCNTPIFLSDPFALDCLMVILKIGSKKVWTW